ncbi:hypothetical protein [Desulfofundulus thermobenzoicus]|uniref:hypothetical protein n=1 Tax=Desulfofundulus thermobenzoicus TaxID=29376 RepID=UPI00188426FA|nr:hypothetical protein [Desulfofundulus thermobenzoicus]
MLEPGRKLRKRLICYTGYRNGATGVAVLMGGGPAAACATEAMQALDAPTGKE